MALITSQVSLVVQGVISMLTQAGVGVWNSEEVYSSIDIGIHTKKVPLSPDRVIVLSSYNVTDDVVLWDRTISLNVRLRGTRSPLDVDNLSETVFNVLHGKHHVNTGALKISRIVRQTSLPLGRDTNDRWELSDNYHVLVQRRKGTDQ